MIKIINKKVMKGIRTTARIRRVTGIWEQGKIKYIFMDNMTYIIHQTFPITNLCAIDMYRLKT